MGDSIEKNKKSKVVVKKGEIIIFHCSDHSKKPAPFDVAALTTKIEKKKEFPNYKIECKKIENTYQVLEVLLKKREKSFEKIKELYIYGHGWSKEFNTNWHGKCGEGIREKLYTIYDKKVLWLPKPRVERTDETFNFCIHDRYFTIGHVTQLPEDKKNMITRHFDKKATVHFFVCNLGDRHRRERDEVMEESFAQIFANEFKVTVYACTTYMKFEYSHNEGKKWKEYKARSGKNLDKIKNEKLKVRMVPDQYGFFGIKRGKIERFVSE